MTPEEVKIIKAICGDGADNVPQCFPRVGVKTAYKLCKDKAKLKEMLKENNEAAKQFLLNRKLIDFDLMPNELKESIVKTVDSKLSAFASDQSAENEMFDLMSL